MEKDDKQIQVKKQKRARVRVALIILVLVFIAIQFFQPDKNNNDVLATNDISSMVPVPDTVQKLLKVACYDCHSNNTVYPWYTNIQPVGWWLEHHVNEGKEELNFNEFANIPAKNGRSGKERQLKKLEDLKEEVSEGEMPLKSYLWIHADARLNKEQRKLISDWADSARKKIAVTKPG